MKLTKYKILEKDIQRSILDYLSLRRVFHFRNNSGAMVSEYKGKQRFMRFGALGSPDIIAVKGGIFYGIECKRPGADQSQAQKEFQKGLEAAGGVYILATSIEDVQKYGL